MFGVGERTAERKINQLDQKWLCFASFFELKNNTTTFYVTGNPLGMVECTPRPPGKSSLLVVGDMRSVKVECFRKIPMVRHSLQRDVDVMLLDVAFVPGVRFNLFSLHAVVPKCPVTLDAKGAHMLNRRLSFTLSDAGSYVESLESRRDHILGLSGKL